MAKNAIRLTQDEIRTGSVITERAKGYAAALDALRATEADYMQLLREKYDLGPEYIVFDWQIGFEVTNDDENN